MPPASAVPGGRRLAAALTAGGAVPAAPPAPLYKPPGRGLAGSLSPVPRVAVDAQWKSAPGSCRGAPVSCESAHALPSPQPSALFFFLCPCIFLFYCCFFPSVTPFPHFLPSHKHTHTSQIASRRRSAAPATPAGVPLLAGGCAAAVPEQLSRRRAVRGAAPLRAAPRRAASEGWCSRQSRAAAPAASAGAETGFSWCGSRAPSFMTARSGESPTPCEVSGLGGVGSGLSYLFLFSGETAGDGVGEEVLCRGRGSEG